MKKSSVFVLLFFLVGFVIAVVVFNQWLSREMAEIERNQNVSVVQRTSAVPVKASVTPKPAVRTGEVIRRTRLAPERTFEISVFYQGGEEIARNKISTRSGKVYDQTGEVPDGRVKFINEHDETYGVEIYKNGILHGPARTNYKSGQTKTEAEYEFGKLKKRKEYYSDGTLKMEEDYSDAREYTDGREVGTGKVFSRDGVIKYEWKMTLSDPIGFQKSYDRYGHLRAEVYYNERGEKVSTKEYPAGTEAVPEAGIQG